MKKESPIFTRTYGLLRWLIPMTVKFPRHQRFVLAARVQQTALRLHEQLIEATHSPQPIVVLHQADVTLIKLRFYLRLCRDLELLSEGQYGHGARMVTEIERLLGGWMKVERPGVLLNGTAPGPVPFAHTNAVREC